MTRDEKTGIDYMRTGDAKYASATDIFSSNRMKKIVSLLKQEYDYVIFDTPPVGAVTDPVVLSTLVDGVVESDVSK